MWKKWKPYIISVAIALGVGALAAFFTRNSMDIYGALNQPPLAPPSWIFPVVWIILYTLMGISSAMVWIKGEGNGIDTTFPLKIYTVQLVFNFLWSIVFFNLRWYLFAYIWLMLLWVLIIVMIVQFRRISRIAGNLQIPYLLWVTFASYLNLMIYILNR